MASNIEPPSFVSNTKTYAEYKEDLKRWSRLTSLEKKYQADMVVYRLDGHPSGVKEKIVTQIGSVIEGKEDGIEQLIKFLDGIYAKDDMADTWEKFKDFSGLVRKDQQPINEFIPDWENCYHRLKTVGCEYPDTVLGFKLLEDARLKELETQLVLTGVDYAEVKSKKNLKDQVTNSLKKFTGRAVVTSVGDSRTAVSVKSEPTWVADMEEVLLAKGWKPPLQIHKGGRRRSRSASPPPRREKSKYKGKKNILGRDGKPLKCYSCKCSHVDSCNCPCVYHLANACPQKRAFPDGQKKDLGLFMTANMPSNIKEVLFTKEDDCVLVVNEQLENLVLLTTYKYEAVVDCACPTTVSGKVWIADFIGKMSDEFRSMVAIYHSERVFKFGGGEKRKSNGVVVFPCFFAGKNVKMRTEVVEADFPLLLGNSMLKRAGAVLFLREEKALVLNTEVKMRETGSGHFCLKIELPKLGVEISKLELPCKENKEANSVEFTEKCITDCMMASVGALTYKELLKLHDMFGHVSMKKLEKLIKNADKWSNDVKENLEEIESKCQSCKVHRKAKPSPNVSLPRASRFNEVVTMDLKEYGQGRTKYILYIIDMFSRLTVGAFIADKNPSTVAEKIMEKWIAPMGRMEMIHSDRGGEFCCEELTNIAEYLGIKSSYTAARSPNQNGLNERNHAIVDNMISKMRSADPQLSAEVALTWALVAKNTLQNVSGFSPFQIVFGQLPSLPSVYTAGPPGLEEVVMSKSVADHINALFLAREAYIQGESDRILKAALKQRVYKRGEDIVAGDWIYFNNTGKWQGPVKVTTKDGKSLYVVRGGRLLTINTDHAQLAMFEGEFLKTPSNEHEGGVEEKSAVNEREGYQESKLKDSSRESTINAESKSVEKLSASAEIDESQENEIRVDRSEEVNDEEVQRESEDVLTEDDTSNVSEEQDHGAQAVKIKKNDVLRIKKDEESGWFEGRVISRAGKVGSKYDKWWNVKNTQTGHIQPLDFDRLKEIQIVTSEENVSKEQNVYVVNIPRYRHHEEACKLAKEEEFKSWEKYEAYEEVEDEGQRRLGTNWVLTEKEVNGTRVVKARLTVRGDQEETTGIRKDSPTVRKGNIKIFATIAAKEGWDIKTCDVTSAFLQGIQIDRDVFILPPSERRVPGVLWKLRKPVYGLVDAPRGWHLALDEEFLSSGCSKCSLDPAMYMYFSNDESEKKIEGIAVTHVDDILHGGHPEFDDNVMSPVKSAFNFGSEGSQMFRYVGMNMVQSEKSIVIDQDHYVQGLELPDMTIAEELKCDELLCAEGQTVFRGSVAKILHVGYQSRPDVCFQAKCLSSKFGKATKTDLKIALKKIQKIQGESTRMCFPDLGEVNNWTIVGYGDAGIRSLPDKLSSVGGQVIMIINKAKSRGCILNWRSKKLLRKVTSSLAGEALAMVATIGEIVYNKAILKQIYGDVIDSVPVVIFTDSKNLSEAIRSTKLVDDAWLIPDIAVIKEALEKGTITCVKRVASEDMLANCLTKTGASAEKLMAVLRTGKYVMPSDADQTINN